MIREIKKKIFIETVLKIPLNLYRFFFMMFFFTLRNLRKQRNAIGNIIRYKKALNSSQSNVMFVFNCFLSKIYDMIFPHLLAENPKKYLKYVCIEGKEYVRQCLDINTGVILISGHCGPNFRALLFKEIFGIDVSTFIGSIWKEKICNSSAKFYKINSSFKYYTVGEEKQFQEGLLRKEWIIFLNDCPVIKRGSINYTLLGKNVYFSELPFKVSIKYKIPILFVGTTRIKHRYHVSILPIDKFQTQQEGLEKYIKLIEELLCRDPYAGFYIAESQF